MASYVEHARVSTVAGPVEIDWSLDAVDLDRFAAFLPCRELLLQVLGGTYALQYRYDGGNILMLRVFHLHEAR